VLGDARHHARTDLFVVVEGKDEILPSLAFKDEVRCAGLTFD
jgi:hypothetical protein